MVAGDEKYKKLLRRWNTLNWLDARTQRQDIEMARINAELTTAELQGRGLSGLADDYASIMAAGDLGGTELL